MDESFTDVLDRYLEMKNTDERAYPGYPGHVDGYTNKRYYIDLKDTTNKLNSFFAQGEK